MLRSSLLYFSLVAACALSMLSSRAAAENAGATSQAAAAPSSAAQAGSEPAQAAPAVAPIDAVDKTSPEAKAAAVPVDHAALLAPEVAAQPAPRDMESDPLFVPGAVLIGGGGAALLASLFTGLGAHGIYSSLEDDCPNNICKGEDQHRIDSGKTLAVVSTVLTGVGIAAAGVGAVFMVLAATREQKPALQPQFGIAKLRLTGGPTPLGLGASASF